MSLRIDVDAAEFTVREVNEEPDREGRSPQLDTAKASGLGARSDFLGPSGQPRSPLIGDPAEG